MDGAGGDVDCEKVVRWERGRRRRTYCAQRENKGCLRELVEVRV